MNDFLWFTGLALLVLAFSFGGCTDSPREREAKFKAHAECIEKMKDKTADEVSKVCGPILGVGRLAGTKG
jgi:hypothetical protein